MLEDRGLGGIGTRDLGFGWWGLREAAGYCRFVGVWKEWESGMGYGLCLDWGLVWKRTVHNAQADADDENAENHEGRWAAGPLARSHVVLLPWLCGLGSHDWISVVGVRLWAPGVGVPLARA